jgi:hypothetical protein
VLPPTKSRFIPRLVALLAIAALLQELPRLRATAAQETQTPVAVLAPQTATHTELASMLLAVGCTPCNGRHLEFTSGSGSVVQSHQTSRAAPPTLAGGSLRSPHSLETAVQRLCREQSGRLRRRVLADQLCESLPVTQVNVSTELRLKL